MKNHIITLTAFLAAGSTLANAGTVITLTDLAKDVSGDITYSSSTGCLEGSSLFSTVMDGATTRYVASATINLDLTALGISSESSTYSGTTELLKFLSAPNSNAGAIGLAAISSGIQFTWQGSAYQSSYSIYWSSLLDNAYTMDGRTYVVLTLEGSAALNAATKGTFVYDKDGVAFVANGGSASYGFSALASGVEYDTVYVNRDCITGVSVFSGIASAEQIKTASMLVAIPEPSVFGLLAGLGALALVGVRRRRR